MKTKETNGTKLIIRHDYISVKTSAWTYTRNRCGSKMSGKDRKQMQMLFPKLEAFIKNHNGNLGESMKELSAIWETL